MKIKARVTTIACVSFGADAARVEAEVAHAIDILSRKAPTPLWSASQSLEKASEAASKVPMWMPSTRKLAWQISSAAGLLARDIQNVPKPSDHNEARLNALAILLSKAKKLHKRGRKICGSRR